MTRYTPCPEWEPRLSAYQDGELNTRERKAVETHLASCAGCRDALATLNADRARFTEVYTREYPDVTQAVLQEVKAMSQSTNQSVISVTMLRWLTGFSAAALLVSLALVVVLFTGPRQQPQPMVVYAPGQSAYSTSDSYESYDGKMGHIVAKRPVANTPLEHDSPSDNLLLTASTATPSTPVGQKVYKPGMGGVFYNPESDRNYGYNGGLKMAYDIGYALQVKNALQSARAGSDIIRNHGGFVIDFDYSGDEGQIPVASVRGKVPAQEAKKAIDELEKMGHITGITLSGDDLTPQYMQYLEEMEKNQKTATNLQNIRNHNGGFVELDAEQARHWAEQQAEANKRGMIGVVTKSSLVEMSVSFAEAKPKTTFGLAQFFRLMRAVLFILLVVLAAVATLFVLLALLTAPVVLLRKRKADKAAVTPEPPTPAAEA